MKEGRELQMMVFSANLGNAQPDEESWNLWIPENGRCKDQTTHYPVRCRKEEDINSHTLQWEELGAYDDYYDDHDQFDILVFGLQESTFDPPKAADSETEQTASTSTRSSTTRMSALSSRAEKAVKKTEKAAKKMENEVKKTLTNLQNLSTSHNYMKDKLADANLDEAAPFTPNQSSHGAVSSSQWQGGTHVLHAMLAKRLPSYERIVSFQRGEMRLEILVHKTHLLVEVLHVAAQNTGRAGLANKGGIVAELLVNGQTRLSFFTAHLEAHEGKYATRVSTIADIFAGTKEKQHDCSMTAHYSFVMGDLNFRTEHPDHEKMGEDSHKQMVRSMVAKKDWNSLNEIDELNRALNSQDALVGYNTLFCNFPPTFKVERQAGYEYIDKRRPSYTDRILWKTSHGLETRLKPLMYEPVDDFTSSDHKPVRAAFSIKMNQTLKLRPKLVRTRSELRLGGLLNGNRRRFTPNEKSGEQERFHLFVSSIVCKLNEKEGSKNWIPNPYVCLISNPPSALQQTVKKGWSKFRHKIRKKFGSANRLDKTCHLTAKGHPRTSIHKQEFAPDFDGEEIHTEVKTHESTGMATDLAGATLKITVMDQRPPMEDDVVIGTVVFNLERVIRKCMATANGDALSSSMVSRQGDNSSRRLRKGPSRMESIIGLFRKSSRDDVGSGFSGELSAGLDKDPIEAVTIEEPLLKNGVVTGTLSCTVELWYMTEAAARFFGEANPFNSDTRQFDGRSSAEDNDEESKRNVLLSPRKERPSENGSRRKLGGSRDGGSRRRLAKKATEVLE